MDRKTEMDKKQNKFFKSKKLPPEEKVKKDLTKKNIVKNKKMKNDSDPEIKIKLNAPMRQTTLSESFSKSTLKTRLRPRKKPVEYKDTTNTSSLLEKSITPDKRNSIVLINRLDDATVNNKVPIYKTAEKSANAKNVGDKDSVYDFQIDPGERKVKIKKKRAPRKPGPNKKKKTKIVAKVLPKTDIDVAAEQNEDVEAVAKPVEVKNKPAIMEKVDLPQPVVEPEAVIEAVKPAEIGDTNPRTAKVKVSRVETLTGDRKVSFKPNLSTSGKNSAKFNPFRSTQSIFKPRPTLNARDMMDHSLLNKSLSPIKGKLDTFDPASPWRPPMPNSFSTVKRVVQSTPQIRQNYGRVTGIRIDENDENDEGRAVKLSNNPLGARTSNTENIEASNVRKFGALLPQEINSSIVKSGSGKKPLGVSSSYGNTKINAGFGDRLYKSPKKSDNKSTSLVSPGMKKRNAQLVSRSRVIDENENSPPSEEDSKLLKQSNLNTFLNLDEMPESIQINTSHGIFSDSVSSTPIIKPQTPKVQPQATVENCFGFEEENSEIRVSPIKLDERQAATPIKKIFNRIRSRVLPAESKNTARISLGEIKNTLYPRREKRAENFERKEEEEEEETRKKERDPVPKSKEMINSIQFSDTFDITSETDQGKGEDKSLGTEIALFVDLEPVHFTQPPRWSYAKKRERKNYPTSDEEEDCDLEERRAPVTKKRKITKLNKAEEKKINDWVNSVNETFQEIDDFDLVIEKLT